MWHRGSLHFLPAPSYIYMHLAWCSWEFENLLDVRQCSVFPVTTYCKMYWSLCKTAKTYAFLLRLLLMLNSCGALFNLTCSCCLLFRFVNSYLRPSYIYICPKIHMLNPNLIQRFLDGIHVWQNTDLIDKFVSTLKLGWLYRSSVQLVDPVCAKFSLLYNLNHHCSNHI